VQSRPGNCSFFKKYLAFTLVGILTVSALPSTRAFSMLPFPRFIHVLMKPDRSRCGNNARPDFSACSLFILLYGASVNSILLFFTRGPKSSGYCMPCPEPDRRVRAVAADEEQGI
jgi:choline-glycine betaine transporter